MPEIAKAFLALVLSGGFLVVFLTAPPSTGLGRARDELAKGFKELAGGLEPLFRVIDVGPRAWLEHQRRTITGRQRPHADLSWLVTPYAGRDACYGCGLAPEIMSPHQWVLCFWCNELRLLLAGEPDPPRPLELDWPALEGSSSYEQEMAAIGLKWRLGAYRHPMYDPAILKETLR